MDIDHFLHNKENDQYSLFTTQCSFAAPEQLNLQPDLPAF